MILETIVTSAGVNGADHIAPMGVHTHGEGFVILPFRPSRTLDNLLETGAAVLNFTDDVRVFAGCLTGRRDWPLLDADQVPCRRLQDTLAHTELLVDRIEDDELRPRVHCRAIHSVNHRPFHGFNRAQFSVLEAAILVSRLGMLPDDKIDREIDYLRIGLEKTAGPRELEAWQWLIGAIATHRAAPRAEAR